MLDGVQTRTRSEHPAGENAFNLALQRHLVDFHESISIRRLGRRPRVTGACSDLKRAELHRFSNRRIKRDCSAGDLVEPGENRAGVFYLLRRRFRNHRILGPRRNISRLRRRRNRGPW